MPKASGRPSPENSSDRWENTEAERGVREYGRRESRREERREQRTRYGRIGTAEHGWKKGDGRIRESTGKGKLYGGKERTKEEEGRCVDSRKRKEEQRLYGGKGKEGKGKGEKWLRKGRERREG